MNYLLAVSGGVDSVVLLDMMAQGQPDGLVVAHFDHGIRKDSSEDADFVRNLAEKYGLKFETKREELGPLASEALARDRRYLFLRDVAKKNNAQIVTAHHLDDLVETVAINLTRGTGWRGLAALDADDVLRPLIDIEKSVLIDYAKKHSLDWREDSTNSDETYLRNRLRLKTRTIPEDEKREIRALHAHQKSLKSEIEVEIEKLVGKGPEYSRYLFTHLPVVVAVEALRYITAGQLYRPQLLRALNAIKVAKSGSRFEAGNNITIHFSTRHFSL